MTDDATSDLSSIVLDLPGFTVLAAGEYGGELELLVETVVRKVACPSCGRQAASHGRREHLLRDLEVADRPVLLVWHKRIWRCRNVNCSMVTWSETVPQISARAVVTNRVRTWVTRRVGQHADTVAALARRLGVGWHTVMRAVTQLGAPLVEAGNRLRGVTALGVDEHAWQRANRHRRTQFATGIVDLTPGRPARLLEVTEGRSGAAYSRWLAARDQAWRQQVTVAALDPFRGYLTALRTHLPAATHVLDAFHIVKLGFATVDEVRRCVQQEQHGHRGRKGDPLYEVRRLLRRRADRLADTHIARLNAALAAADPDAEVTAAWLVAQDLALVYATGDAQLGRRRAAQVIDTARDCPVPEVKRLGRTLASWRGEILAYFDRPCLQRPDRGNLLIAKVRRVGHGYRNWHNYRLRLLLHCGIAWDTLLTQRIRRLNHVS